MSARPYRSPDGLRRWLVAMLTAMGGVAAVALVSAVVDIVLWSDAADNPAGASMRNLVLADNRRVALALLQLAGLLATGVVFIVWFRRLYINLPALGVEPKQPRWLAVGGWFLPVANLFVPWVLAKELAQTGDAPGRARLVHGWWVGWILASLFGLGATSVRSDAVLPQEYADAAGAAALYEVVLGAAAVLAILVVRALTDRQERQAEQGVLTAA